MKIKDKKTGKVKDVKLPKAFKIKWLKALRSGDYLQSTHFLQTDAGYCCLGVACRIEHPKMKLKGLKVIKGSKFHVPNILKGDDADSLNSYNIIVDKLASMNDAGKSFKQIANYIEKNL